MIDSHCHLNEFDAQFSTTTLLQQASDVGVSAVIVPAIGPDSWHNILQLTQQYSNVYCTLGIHPLVEFENSSIEQSYYLDLERLLTSQSIDLNSHCVGIGECGLDYYDFKPSLQCKQLNLEFHSQWLVQRQLLQQQRLIIHFKLAQHYQLPLILHVRQAHQQLISLLKQYPTERGGVIHGFSGSYELAQQYIKLGFYIGIGGVISYPRAQKTRQTIAKTPLNHLLLETDAPWMPLLAHQGQPNQPSQLLIVAKIVAQLQGCSLHEVIKQTSNNAMKLFGIKL